MATGSVVGGALPLVERAKITLGPKKHWQVWTGVPWAICSRDSVCNILQRRDICSSMSIDGLNVRFGVRFAIWSCSVCYAALVQIRGQRIQDGLRMLGPVAAHGLFIQ